MTAQPKYLEQLDRVRRWHQQYQGIAQGWSHDRLSDFYQDIVYSFFMNCYHLKDWIKNDPTSGPLSARVEGFISNTPEMAICADICNGLKHLVLTDQRSGQNPRFGKRRFTVGVGTQPTTIAVEYTIDTSSGPIDAFALATRCLQAWETFIMQ
jgi:hypothetical protein